MIEPTKFVFYVVLEDGAFKQAGHSQSSFFHSRSDARKWINENDDESAGHFSIRRAKGVLFDK